MKEPDSQGDPHCHLATFERLCPLSLPGGCGSAGPCYRYEKNKYDVEARKVWGQHWAIVDFRSTLYGDDSVMDEE